MGTEPRVTKDRVPLLAVVDSAMDFRGSVISRDFFFIVHQSSRFEAMLRFME